MDDYSYDAFSGAADSSTGFWDQAGSKAIDLVYGFANKKLNSLSPTPAGTYSATAQPVRTNVVPYNAQAASSQDAAQQIGEILSSPRTWMVVGAVVLLVVVVKFARR